MINGDVNEFVDGLYYGDERIFLYNDKKYFIQGYGVDGKPTLFLETWEPPSDDYIWQHSGDGYSYPVEDFLAAPIFDGKTFWEVEQEIEWVDD